MSRFIESIQLLDGRLLNLNFHQKRLDATQKKFFGSSTIDLSEERHKIQKATTGKYKLRLVYDALIREIDIVEYKTPVINSLKLVESNLDYSYKFEDRNLLQELYDRRSEKDDILIIKEGLITDSFYCNVALRSGDTWYTPENPLLRGTKRGQLIQSKKLVQARIQVLHWTSTMRFL